MVTVLIVGADVRFCQTTRASLKDARNIDVLGEARDENEAMALIHELKPDLILLDIDTAGMAPQKIVARFAELHPKGKIIILSATDEKEWVLDAFREGAQGHLIKGVSTPQEIVKAIHTVGRGDSILSPRMAGMILDEVTSALRQQKPWSQSTELGEDEK